MSHRRIRQERERPANRQAADEPTEPAASNSGLAGSAQRSIEVRLSSRVFRSIMNIMNTCWLRGARNALEIALAAGAT